VSGAPPSPPPPPCRDSTDFTTRRALHSLQCVWQGLSGSEIVEQCLETFASAVTLLAPAWLPPLLLLLLLPPLLRPLLPQAAGADLVIALTHMRQPNDILLAQQVPEIDAVLGGHDHFYNVGLARHGCKGLRPPILIGYQDGACLEHRTEQSCCK